MDFRVLGPFEVEDEGRILRLGSGKQLALVAALVLRANEAVSVDRLVDDLWGEAPPPTAAKIVRNAVSLLRRELGDRLVTQPPGYLLRVGDDELDSRRLERAVQSRDLDELTQALALWRGPPLSQFTYEAFAQNEIARLEELRLRAIEERLEALLARGDHEAVVPELERLALKEPVRERLHGQLMLALYRSGRQADALEAYQRLRRNLDDQVGIEPGPAMKELERGILNQDDALAAPARAEPAAPGRVRRPVGLAVAAAALLVAATATFLATRDSAAGLPEVPPNYVGVIDPEANATVAAIPVGLRPGPLAAGNGSVWVGNLEDRNVTRIDAGSRAPAGTVSLENRTPTGLAVGAGAVWVAHGPRGDLTRIDARFRETRTVTVRSGQFSSATGSVAVGAGHVWAAYGDSALARIEPSGMRVSGVALTGARPSSVAVGGGAVWVANYVDSVVQRFDPVTFQQGPIATIPVGRRPSALAYGYEALWVASAGDDVVTRFDPTTGSSIPIPVGDEPVAVATGAGAVWVANSGDASVSRIDPEERKVVETIDVGNSPAGLVVHGGLVWVATQAR